MNDIIKDKKAKPFARKRGKSIGENIWLYAMCVIPMLILFVFKYLPMFGMIIAFKDYRYDMGILKSPWVGFDNLRIKSKIKFVSILPSNGMEHQRFLFM